VVGCLRWRQDLVLRNDGDAELLNLMPVSVTFEVHPPTREQGSDRPGRVYQSQGTARSAMEEKDRHSEAERTPPKALGILRGHLLPLARARIVAEIAKDLVKLPIPEIEKHLAA
jgi:protein required for attachment to host cells